MQKQYGGNDMVEELVGSFFEPLKQTDDLAVDYLEIGLDALIKSDIVEAIPVVKSFVHLYKLGMSIREHVLAKNWHCLHLIYITAMLMKQSWIREEKQL